MSSEKSAPKSNVAPPQQVCVNCGTDLYQWDGNWYHNLPNGTQRCLLFARPDAASRSSSPGPLSETLCTCGHKRIDHDEEQPYWCCWGTRGIDSNNVETDVFCDCEGFEVAALAASSPIAQPWISVKDRLPEEDQTVLAAIPFYDNERKLNEVEVLHCSYYQGGMGSAQKIFTTCEGEEYEAGDVTHWQPLPEPPEVEKL